MTADLLRGIQKTYSKDMSMLYPFLLVFHFSNIIFKQHNRDEMTYLHRLALNKTPHTSYNSYLFQPEAFLNDIHLVQQILLVLIMEPEQFLKCSADKNISNSHIHMTIKHILVTLVKIFFWSGHM